MTISVIIPTLNEAANISRLLPYLKQCSNALLREVIVVDGGSRDNTVEVACKAGITVLRSSKKNRAFQMNLGAKEARGDVFYFVHADALPPKTFLQDICFAIEEGYGVGCYRFQFDSKRVLLKINAYCTRFNRIMCRGGDQTLFVERKLFERTGKFNEDFVIMEDYDFIQKAQKLSPFKIIPKNVVVSARKYEKNNYLKVNAANFIIFILYFAGCSQEKMISLYKKMLHYP